MLSEIEEYIISHDVFPNTFSSSHYCVGSVLFHDDWELRDYEILIPPNLYAVHNASFYLRSCARNHCTAGNSAIQKQFLNYSQGICH